MNLKKTSGILLIVAAPLLVLGCGATDLTSEMTGTLTENPAQGSPGPLKYLAKALKTLDLRADQRVTLEALMQTTQDKMTPMREAGAAAAKELARQVRLGAIDQGQLELQMAQLKTAAQGSRPVITQALNTLHRTLDPTQRTKLVGSLKDRHEKRRWGHHGKKIKKLAQKIGLTDDQLDRIRELMMAQFKGHRSEMKKHHQDHRAQLNAAAEAFQTEQFDASSFAFFKERTANLQPHTQRFVQMARQVLPLLTPEQREKLAQMIEKKGQGMGPAW